MTFIRAKIYIYFTKRNRNHNCDDIITIGATRAYHGAPEPCGAASTEGPLSRRLGGDDGILNGRNYDTPVTIGRICAALNSPLNRTWIGATFRLFGSF
jgi:hypothetical protein